MIYFGVAAPFLTGNAGDQVFTFFAPKKTHVIFVVPFSTQWKYFPLQQALPLREFCSAFKFSLLQHLNTKISNYGYRPAGLFWCTWLNSTHFLINLHPETLNNGRVDKFARSIDCSLSTAPLKSPETVFMSVLLSARQQSE